MPTRIFSVTALILCLQGVSFACSSGGTPGGTEQVGSPGTAGGGQSSSGAGGTSASGATSIAGTSSVNVGGGAGASAAGAGGMSAVAGASGSVGSGGAANATPSTGCGMPTTQALASYVKFTETVSGVDPKWASRNYYVFLPTGYDPKRAYPTVFVGPGCGATGDMGIPMFQASHDNAIIIGLDPDPAAEGRSCFNSESYPDPEEPYFNETLKEVEAKYCVDKSHLFVEGFSSGSWLTNLIGCVDGDVIRGQGNASGCMQGAHPTCKGPIAFMGAHDMGDPANSYQCGVENRDRIVKLNGCSDQTMPYDPGPNITIKPPVTVSCVQYIGCKPGYPVVWCTTTNLGHNDQVGTGLSTFGFWKFWMSLP